MWCDVGDLNLDGLVKVVCGEVLVMMVWVRCCVIVVVLVWVCVNVIVVCVEDFGMYCMMNVSDLVLCVSGGGLVCCVVIMEWNAKGCFCDGVVIVFDVM